jgi:hypothetical protein
MRKVIFYIALALSLVLLLNILKIFITDFSRLTSYGYGYLAGKIVLFILFGALVYRTRKTKPPIKKESNP